MVFPPEGWLPEGYVAPVAGDCGSDEAMGVAAWKSSGTYQFKLIFLTFVFSAGAGLMSIGLMKLYPWKHSRERATPQPRPAPYPARPWPYSSAWPTDVGRIAWGMMSDLMGRKASIIIMTATQGLCVIAFPTVAQNELVLYVGAAFIGFNFGGNFALSRP